MSKSNFTPGPWNFYRLKGRPTEVVIRPMGYKLSTSNETENEANARLIAAAPELLEALERANETICFIVDNFKMTKAQENSLGYKLRSIDEVINKARGE